MKKFYTLVAIGLLAFSCQRQADPVPTPIVDTPQTAFQVGINLYDQYNQFVASEGIGQVRVVLTGEKLQKDTTFEITSFTSSRIKFDNIPIGSYELAIIKEGYVGERYSFKIIYQDKRFLIDYQNRQSEILPFSNFFELRLAEISTLGAGQITYLQQDAQNIYLQLNFPVTPRLNPYFRFFLNKGKHVSVQHHTKTYAYFVNFISSDNAVIQLWRSDLQMAGFQKGDTVSVIGYGDNYINKELVSATPFACLSNQSSNLATLVLE